MLETFKKRVKRKETRIFCKKKNNPDLTSWMINE